MMEKEVIAKSTAVHLDIRTCIHKRAKRLDKVAK